MKYIFTILLVSFLVSAKFKSAIENDQETKLSSYFFCADPDLNVAVVNRTCTLHYVDSTVQYSTVQYSLFILFSFRTCGSNNSFPPSLSSRSYSRNFINQSNKINQINWSISIIKIFVWFLKKSLCLLKMFVFHNY